MRMLPIMFGALGFAGLAIAVPTHESTQQQAATVQLNITCGANGGVDITVTPWRAELAQGQDIDWALAEAASSDSFAIDPKRPGAPNWPFPATGRQTGTKASRVRYQNMKPNQRGRRYQYNITMWCQRPDGADTVVIDPDIVIR